MTAADGEVLRRLAEAIVPDAPHGFDVRFAIWGTGHESQVCDYDRSLPRVFAAHRTAVIAAVEDIDARRFDETVENPGHFDEEHSFEFETTGEMILALLSYT